MNKTQYFLRKHSSTMLTVAGAAGVVGTTVLAVKATPKALLLLEEAKKEKEDELTLVEVVKVAWKPYIPAIIVGGSTIACIISINHLSAKSQASLMSAYALLDSSYKEYQNKVKDIYGEDADHNVKQELAKAKMEDRIMSIGDKQWFFDFQSVRFFESTMEDVMKAECMFLDLLSERGYACLNEYYDFLGLPHIKEGYQLGWIDNEQIDPYGCEALEFDYTKTTRDDGVECWIIDMNITPSTDFVL